MMIYETILTKTKDIVIILEKWYNIYSENLNNTDVT